MFVGSMLWVALQGADILRMQSPISVHSEVGPAYKAIEAISKASGVNLRADEPTRYETVFISAKNRPLGEVAAKLAEAVGGKWAKDDKGFILIRDDLAGSAATIAEKDRQALAEYADNLLLTKDFQYTEENFKRALDEKQKHEKMPNSVGDSESHRRRQKIWSYDPIFRVMGACLKSIDLSSVAKLDAYDEITFSSNPKGREMRLGLSTWSAAKNLIEDQKLWGSLLKKLPTNSVKFFTDGQIEQAKKLGRAWEIRTVEWGRTLPYPATTTDLSFTVSRTMAGSFEATIQLLDSSKQVLEKLRLPNIWAWSKEKPDTFMAVARFPVVPPTAETEAFLQRKKDSKEPLPILQRFFLDPVNHDPLWFGNHEVLEHLSKTQAKSVVACLPDRASLSAGEEISLKSFVKNSSNGLDFHEDTDWMVVSPSDFGDHRVHRLDRRTLAAYTKERSEKKSEDIILYARLAQTNSALMRNVNLTDPEYYDKAAFSFPLRPATTKLLTSLTPAQYDQLRSGNFIPYEALKPEQAALYDQITQGKNFLDVSAFVIGYDPTEVSRFKEPGLSLECRQNEYVALHDPAILSSGKDDPFCILNFVKPFAKIGRGPRAPSDGLKRVTYDIRTNRSIILKLHVTDGQERVGVFTQPVPRASSKPVTLDQLPPEARARIEDERAWLEGNKRS